MWAVRISSSGEGFVMTVLPNARHESFAQALAKGKSAAAAYMEAGYTADRARERQETLHWPGATVS